MNEWISRNRKPKKKKKTEQMENEGRKPSLVVRHREGGCCLVRENIIKKPSVPPVAFRKNSCCTTPERENISVRVERPPPLKRKRYKRGTVPSTKRRNTTREGTKKMKDTLRLALYTNIIKYFLTTAPPLDPLSNRHPDR